jgi:hypothetical protein
MQPLGEPVYTCQYTDYSLDYTEQVVADSATILERRLDYADPDNLERALGFDFQGVVQRELVAK